MTIIFVNLILVFLFHRLMPIGDDAPNFYLMGSNLAKGISYSLSYRNANFYPPGYPCFLGGIFYPFGSSNFILQFANSFLYTGALLLIYLVSKELFHSEFSARISLLILAFHPSQISFILWTTNEVLFLFVFLLATYCLLQSKKHIIFTLLGGFIFGIACLIKPQALFLPFIYFFSKILWQKQWKSNLKELALVYFVLLCTLLPWTIRNYSIHHGFMYISSQGGLGLLTATHPNTDGTFQYYKTMPELWHDYKSLPNDLEKNRWAFRKSLEYIKNDPIRLIKLWPHKLKTLYGIYEYPNKLMNACFAYTKAHKKERHSFYYWFYSKTNRFLYFNKVSLYIKIYHWIFLSCFLISIFLFQFFPKNKFKDAPFPLLGIGFILYFTFLYMIFISWARFSFPILPWMAIYIGVGIQILWKYKPKASIS